MIRSDISLGCAQWKYGWSRLRPSSLTHIHQDDSWSMVITFTWRLSLSTLSTATLMIQPRDIHGKLWLHLWVKLLNVNRIPWFPISFLAWCQWAQSSKPETLSKKSSWVTSCHKLGHTIKDKDTNLSLSLRVMAQIWIVSRSLGYSPDLRLSLSLVTTCIPFSPTMLMHLILQRLGQTGWIHYNSADNPLAARCNGDKEIHWPPIILRCSTEKFGKTKRY